MMQTLANFDFDNWLGYSTNKTVFIRDRWLGFIYYGLVAVILAYIVGVQILYLNEHFLLSPVEGIARMKVSHPVKGRCDPSLPDCKSGYRSLQELSYCMQYTGSMPLKHQANCHFDDALSILPNGEVDNKVFIPTAIEILTEKRLCEPSAENGYNCDNEYEELPGSECLNGKVQCRKRGGKDNQFYFVADTKNFEIQFTSSYEEGDVTGTSLDHAAFYEICDAKLRAANKTHDWKQRLQHHDRGSVDCGPDNVRHVLLPCAPGVPCLGVRDFDLVHDSGMAKIANESVHKVGEVADAVSDPIRMFASPHVQPSSSETMLNHHHHHHSPQFLAHGQGLLAVDQHSDLAAAPHRHGVEANIDFKKQYTSAYGDVFTLERLMELAGTDLDKNFNMEGWSSRESGTVLEVTMIYSNLHAWKSSFGYKDVEYYYRVKELPLPFMSRQQLAQEQPADFPKTRRYEIRHGVLIWFRVAGEFGNFSRNYLLIYLVTAFALIGAAKTLTDVIAIYVHQRKNNYFNLKYEVSPDFKHNWQCPKCRYWNSQAHEACQSYGMWLDKEEEPFCGTLKPADQADRSFG